MDWFVAVIAEALPHLEPATIGTRLGSRLRPDVRSCDKWTAPYDSRAWTFTEALAGPVDEVQEVRYQRRGFYARHRDNDLGLNRATTIVIQLSDSHGYTGGDLIVGGKVQPRARGAVIRFPASTMHECRPVRTGERWVIVAWTH